MVLTVEDINGGAMIDFVIAVGARLTEFLGDAITARQVGDGLV